MLFNIRLVPKSLWVFLNYTLCTDFFDLQVHEIQQMLTKQSLREENYFCALKMVFLGFKDIDVKSSYDNGDTIRYLRTVYDMKNYFSICLYLPLIPFQQINLTNISSYTLEKLVIQNKPISTYRPALYIVKIVRNFFWQPKEFYSFNITRDNLYIL